LWRSVRRGPFCVAAPTPLPLGAWSAVTLYVHQGVGRLVLSPQRAPPISSGESPLHIADDGAVWPVAPLSGVLQIPMAGHYAWRSHPEGKRAAENRAPLDDICRVREAGQRRRHGGQRVFAASRACGRRVGQRRVERAMRHQGMRGRIARPQRVQADAHLAGASRRV